MKLLIAGSRGIENFDLSKYIEKDIDTILSGGAKGIDTLAEEYADKMDFQKSYYAHAMTFTEKLHR